MEKIGFYLDEHIQTSLAEALRQRGVDVLTTQEAGNIALNDYEQLSFAYKKGRVVLSYNKRDFARIHYEFMKINKTHSGIVLSDQLPVGQVLKRLMRLYFSFSREDMKNRLEYLSA
jgi:predicted nuclease of predicted toxin-antitoxin system